MKIAINGAGIAGPTLAYWLCRTGHEPTLIEKAPQFRTGGYVIDFWGVGYTIAERMGILPELHEAGYAVEEVRLVDRSSRKVGGFSTRGLRKLTGNRFTSLPRGDLAETIYRTVRDRVETIFGDTIASIDQDDAGVRVGFEHGPPREFDLVIGADGLHSTVRALVFGPETRFERQLGYRVAAFALAGYRPRDELVYVSYAMPGREVARFALRHDRTMFLLVFLDELAAGSAPRDTDQRKAILRRVYADAGWECPQILPGLEQAEDIYFDQVSQIRMESWSRGRVMLIGDAAACASLLAGEGSGLAMAEAHVLAGKLKAAQDDYAEAFRRYERRLRPFIEGKQRAARRFASAFAPRTRLGIWLRNQVTRLMAIPRLANFLLGRAIQDDFDLPDYKM